MNIILLTYLGISADFWLTTGTIKTLQNNSDIHLYNLNIMTHNETDLKHHFILQIAHKG